MKKIIKAGFFLAVLLAMFHGALAQDNKNDYKLGAGDAIKINIFQNPDLSIETRVSESGTITYPLIGSVTIGGLAIPDAENVIAGKLRDGGFVQKPQVNILLIQIRGNQVSVLGQVGRPGRYPIETGNTRITDMLALAGGAIQNGSDTIILTGTREGQPFRQEIDIPALFLQNKPELDLVVKGGDVIYVHRAQVFYIYGEVQHAGVYRLERDMTVLQALAQGGGLTMRGTERGLRIHRRGADGKISVFSPEKDQLVHADDVIYIQESFF